MKYRWKDKAHGVRGLSVTVVAQRLEQIRDDNDGRITPQAVVDDARPKDSLLHTAFEWNNKRAADEYRLDQARRLIRNVVVVFEGKSDSEPVRAFVNVLQDGDEDRSYTSMVHAMREPELRRQVLEQALAEVKAWKKRYADYRELAEIFDAIESVEAA